MVKITKRNVALATLTMALMGSNASLGLLGEHNLVLAAKNHDGVCQVETKTGELKFNAKSTTELSYKPLDLLLVMDGSGSINDTKAKMMFEIYASLLKTLPEDTKVSIAIYGTNRATSYESEGPAYDAGPMTVAEALGLIQPLADNFAPLPQDLVRAIGASGKGNGGNHRPYETWFASNLRPDAVHSVLQITDEWIDYEEIDGSFAAWAKANAKTFMSVIMYPNNNTTSYRQMTNAGHPNIYVTGGKDIGTITQEVNSQFTRTATEKVTKPKTTINVVPEQGLTLKEVKLVSPDGKEEVLPIQGNKVNVVKDLPKDGDWTVKVKADGLVHENRKVVTTVNVGGKEVGKNEILFEGCNDDVKGKDEERTKVNIDFKTNYIEDKDLPFGTEKVVTDGVIGIKEIIKTWSTINGKRVGEPKIVENMLQGVIDKVIARGTKGFDREVIKQKIPFDTKYIDDEKLESGKTKVVTEGIEGEKEITKVYVTQSGKRVGEPTVTEKVVKPKVDKVIARGTQQPKDFTYRVLDKDGKVLVDTTKVAQGYIGNEYKLAEVPKLEGYEVVTPEGIKLDGIFNGENVNIDFVAYKLGDEVSLDLVDDKGKALGKGQVLVEKGKRVGVDFSGKVEKEFKDGDRLYRLTELKLGDTKLEGLEFTGKVTEVAQKYVAQYKEVLPAPVKVNFVDENGKELQKPVNLLKEASRLDGDYTYTPEKRVKVGTDEYALVKVTLDGKEVKEIKGKFTEKEQVYKVEYKKVLKPAPAKLPKTSASDDLRGYGIVATLLGVLGFLGFRRFK